MNLQASPCTCEGPFPSIDPCDVHGQVGKQEYERLQQEAGELNEIRGIIQLVGPPPGYTAAHIERLFALALQYERVEQARREAEEILLNDLGAIIKRRDSWLADHRDLPDFDAERSGSG